MYEQKPKIGSLSRKELTKILTECFFLVGKDFLKLNPDEIEAMLKETMHWKGWMWVDTFREAFSSYAAGELNIDGFHPTLTPMSVSKITKAYQDKTFGKKDKIEKIGTDSILTDAEKFALFFKHVKFYGSLPGLADWISIYNFLVSGRKIIGESKSWSNENYKFCESKVKEFMYAEYGDLIHDNNIFKGDSGSRPLKGLGQRAKEFLGV